LLDRTSPGHPCPVYSSNVTVVEVDFDEADIAGSFHDSGHPGVLGLWLNDYTVGDTIGGGAEVYALDLTTYTVPDLQPAANGWMYRRGEVWEPPHQRRDYP
jgi:hypothetical protein